MSSSSSGGGGGREEEEEDTWGTGQSAFDASTLGVTWAGEDMEVSVVVGHSSSVDDSYLPT